MPYGRTGVQVVEHMIKRSLQIIKATIAEYSAYRLNFVLWRVRMLMQLLVIYFLWHAVYSGSTIIAGYDQSRMLTYILFTSIVRTIVLSTTTMDIGNVINQGDLSNFLIKPLTILEYYVARDIADKLLNVLFAVMEVSILFLLMKPEVLIQNNPAILFMALVATIVGTVLYFLFSMLLGFLGFWTPDIWAPRFLSFVLMEFFAGSLFPLDILPPALFKISQLLPFGYFAYFPVKVYMGTLNPGDIINGLVISVSWIVLLAFISHFVWVRGLRMYSAEGR